MHGTRVRERQRFVRQRRSLGGDGEWILAARTARRPSDRLQEALALGAPQIVDDRVACQLRLRTLRGAGGTFEPGVDGFWKSQTQDRSFPALFRIGRSSNPE